MNNLDFIPAASAISDNSSSDDTVAASNTVAVIGCGPGGMFFLHALATKRKQLEDAGDIEGLMKLPIVTVFEKSASPGGVWRSDRNLDDQSDKDESNNHGDTQNLNDDALTNMYEGLWINGHKDGMEFFDYTFEEHFKTPQPVFLPRQQILEYMMARVTKHEDIFQNVLFNTSVDSVTYDDEDKQFVIISRDQGGVNKTSHFDKCIWASGENGKPKMPAKIVENLGDYKGQLVHSSAMDKLSSSSPDGKNAVEGKRILLIGDSYSGEDLALQCIKLGAEKIFVTTRSAIGSASYMGSWPEDKVKILSFTNVSGIKDDGTGRTIVFDALDDDHPAPDVEDVSIVICCTGYIPNLHMLEDKLQPWKEDEDSDTWCMEDVGKNTNTWRMKENSLTPIMGHVEPSTELELNSEFVLEDSYQNLLISNPNMMFILETGSYSLLCIDVIAWLCVAYVTGDRAIPTREEMLEANKVELLASMQEHSIRYEIDDNFSEAVDAIPVDHWYHDPTSDEYYDFIQESDSYELRVLAGNMRDANYPLNIGDVDGLNKIGAKLLHMMCVEERERYLLENCDEDTKKWKTFRDMDPSPFCSLVTGMGSVPLKGKWLEIDDDGNPV